MRTLYFFIATLLILSSCQEEASDSNKELTRLRKELEQKRQALTDQKEIAKLEEELNRIDRELNQVSTGTATKPNDAPKTASSVGFAPDTEGAATIVGNSVNMRSSPSVQATRIASFSNGEIVRVLEATQSGKNNEAILTKNIELYSDGNQTGKPLATLNKGKAVVIEGYQGDMLNVSYQHPERGKLFAQIKESDVESIENGAWYKVTRSNGQTGWVYEKFISIK
jgi:uncharacterized protein YgiM (DUF1202 family)